MIASVAVSSAIYAIDKPYSYNIPDGMTVFPGMRVILPFGNGNRRCEGIILTLSNEDGENLKYIESVQDESPVISEEFLRLAAFIRERYFCTFYEAIKAILPAGLWFQASEQCLLTDKEVDEKNLQKNSAGFAIWKYLKSCGGKTGLTQLQNAFPDKAELESGLRYLKKKKYLQCDQEYSKRLQDKTEKIAVLAVSPEEAMKYAERKKRSAPMQYEVLKLLCAIGSGSTKEISYLTGASMNTIHSLESLGYLQLSVREVFRSSLPDQVNPAGPLVLNPAQYAVFEQLDQQSLQENPGVALLYGVTGSGKTSVYIQLIRRTLEKGKSSILLVPEISLTPQLVRLLMSYFGKNVAVLHSGLRITERYDTWKRINQGDAHVIIGTRSAVFAPVSCLGLLIVDEEQEHSYKSENSPRYHAREIAIYRGAKEHALVVLGSATPSLESMYLAKTGVYSLFRLPERFNGKQLPEVQLIDMKQELRSGNSSALSLPLQRALAENIEKNQQSILFLNRRGASRYLICVNCGRVPMCPRCSISLTYHIANQRLMCHYCGHSEPLPEQCPDCGGHLKTVGIGTQRVEEDLHGLFPDTEILRMDADTISASNSHENVLERFQKERVPILIGTQMVTKGLNFENVTLVGVIDADTSLYVDHYRAAETTFSLLTQVIGRAGRGEKAGRALIQTMTPEHTVLRLASEQDYDQFYDLEITMRYLQKAPPYGDVFTVFFLSAFEELTLSGAVYFRRMLENALSHPSYCGLPMEILGPSPAAVYKINNAYREQITVKCSNQRIVRQLFEHLLKQFSKDKKSKGITSYIDINAYG